jgi:hypothetical protein
MDSIQIYLNSANADKLNGNISDAEYNLPPFEIPDGYHIYLSVQSVTIPYSFYNVNDSNNLLSYNLKDQSINNVTFVNGNYNITEVVDYLKSIMIGFDISYNNITNKLTFKHTVDFYFLNDTTCFKLLGFDNNKSYQSTSLTLTSVNCVNIIAIKRINVSSNFITYNINKSAANNYSILCSIPVNKPPYSLIEYTNNNNFRTDLFINYIHVIKIKLTDERENLIDLNGNNYCMTIQLDVEKFT